MNQLTLDGVMQGPGHPDEDMRDGFAHGGCVPHSDEAMVAKIGERMGSGVLIGSLMAADAIDEYLLMMIYPLVLGSGRQLFAGGTHAVLRLIESITTRTGVVIATYEPA